MPDLVSSGELAAPPGQPLVMRYGAALGMAAAATLLAVLTDLWVHIPNLSLVFVLPVLVAAVSFGWGPALTAALVGVVCFNFFLIEPRYTFRVADPSNVWALGLLLIVAGVVSALAAQTRRQAVEALEHARQAQALQSLAHALAAAPDRQAISGATARALHSLFGSPTAVIVTEPAGREVTAAPHGAILSEEDLDAADLAMAAGRATRGDAFPTNGARFDFWPVLTPSRRRAAIGLRFTEGAARPQALEALIQIVGGNLGVSLDREAHARDAAAARLEAASERLKTDLLAAVSHDLRTPLSTILVTLQSLQRFGDAHDPATRNHLLGLAETETSRLARLVGGLLDMGRIEAGVVTVRPSPVSPAVLVASALERADGALSGRTVLDEVAHDLPEVLIDPALTETALANVLENAGKYGPAGSTVTIRGAHEGGAAVIEVLDEGPGFPKDVEPLFDKFTRGVEGDGRPPGAGLGLSIARGFLRAQGAEIDAQNRSDRRGGRVRLVLPLARLGPA